MLQIHRPALGVEVERERPLLAHAEARFLRASEGELILDSRRGQVDRDESRLDAIDELMHARESLEMMAAERPNRTPLARRMASSKSSATISASTGPKTSSCAMRIAGVTPPKMVGSMKKPLS